MTGRRGRLATALTAAFGGLLSSAALHAETFGQAEICDATTKTLDRERLALAALAATGVSPYPYRWVETHGGLASGGLTIAQQLLSVEGFCGQEPALDQGIARCGKDDAKHLGEAQNLVIEVLEQTDKYAVPAGLNGPGALFAASSTVIVCRAASDGSLGKAVPTAIAAPFEQKDVPIRLRGSTDGLQFDRNRDSAFAGVDKAAITFKSDRAAGKDTFKATIVAALAVPVVPDVLELVPYMGFQIDTAKKDAQPKDITDDMVRVGMLVDFRSHGNGISHLFLLRPEYAANRKDNSEVLTGTFTYQPVVNGWMNDAINVTTSDNRSLFSVIPRWDVRLTTGHFSRLGTRLAENSHDLVRVGEQIGVTLTSDIKWLPLELSVTETYLRALKGEPDELSYLKAVFSLYFDDKKYFGIDVAYARGRRDDLLDREHNWSVGFGAKF